MNELNLKVTVPNELVGELFQNGLSSVIDRCTVEVMGVEMVATKPQPIVTTEPEKSETPRVRKKMIKFVCPDCGRFNYAVVEENNKKYHMTCYGCRVDYEFTNMDLVRAEYRCTDCDSENWFFTPYIEGMEVKEDTCRCGKKTKLKYDVNNGGFCEVEA